MLAVLINLSTLEPKKARYLAFLDLLLTRRPFHPIPNTPQLLHTNQPIIPQHNRQLGHCGLLLTGDQSEGGFGKAQVLLEVGDELGVVHWRAGVTLLVSVTDSVACFGQGDAVDFLEEL